MPQSETVVIDRRFRGPPDSGNGGYTCGLLGRTLGPSAEVSLRLPPPLGTPLRIDGQRMLAPDGSVIAEGESVDFDVRRPPAPTVEEVRACAEPDRSAHAFPECFVCGPHRERPDGLRLIGREVPGFQGAAEVWEPQDAVPPEIVWAAMDCPTFWGGVPRRPCVLARLGVSIHAPVEPGPHVIHAWPAGSEGRKHFAEEALYDAAGNVVAIARALWIELRDPAAFQARVA